MESFGTWMSAKAKRRVDEALLLEQPQTKFVTLVPGFELFANARTDLGFEDVFAKSPLYATYKKAFEGNGIRIPNSKYRIRGDAPGGTPGHIELADGSELGPDGNPIALPANWMSYVVVTPNTSGDASYVGKLVRVERRPWWDGTANPPVDPRYTDTPNAWILKP